MAQNVYMTESSADEWHSAVTDLLRILTTAGGWHPAEDLDRIAEVRRLVAGRAETDRDCPGGAFKSGVVTDQRETAVTQHSAAGGDLEQAVISAARRWADAERVEAEAESAVVTSVHAPLDTWRDVNDAHGAARAATAEAADALHAAARALTPAGVPSAPLAAEPPVCRTTAELHSSEAHQDYEYETTKGPRKSWWPETPWANAKEPQWERNVHRGRNGWERFDEHEEAYWMRRRPSTVDGPAPYSSPVDPLAAIAALYGLRSLTVERDAGAVRIHGENLDGDYATGRILNRDVVEADEQWRPWFGAIDWVACALFVPDIESKRAELERILRAAPELTGAAERYAIRTEHRDDRR